MKKSFWFAVLILACVLVLCGCKREFVVGFETQNALNIATKGTYKIHGNLIELKNGQLMYYEAAALNLEDIKYITSKGYKIVAAGNLNEKIHDLSTRFIVFDPVDKEEITDVK